MRPRRLRFIAKVTVATAALIVAMPHATAGAQPEDGSSDAMERYQQLGARAAQTEEDLSQAEIDLAAKQQARDEANAAVASTQQALDQAQQTETPFRGEMDQITGGPPTHK